MAFSTTEYAYIILLTALCLTGWHTSTSVPIPSSTHSMHSPTLTTATPPQSTLCNKTYAMYSDDERICFTGLQCKHGKCEPLFGCVCHPGATGFLCEIECCLDCGDHGNCFYDSSDNVEICNCESNYRGERCDIQIETSTMPMSNCSLPCPDGFECTVVLEGSMMSCIPKSTTNRTSTPPTPAGLLCDAPYVMRNLTERQCPGGLVCQRGYCVLEDGVTHCECDDGAHGLLCENACCKHCGENGTCYFDVLFSEEVCNCYNGFTGDNCSDVITTPAALKVSLVDDWYLWVVGVSVGLLVILLVLIVVLPYILWRHRVILVMKIVHYFQGYEDDDEREWDAFISYKSAPRDEEFVMQKLFPQLTHALGFNIHLHHKDFIPGETIANNIIRAVKGSRRTILVISPNFVKSEFTRFEYQTAQQEMLKHKHRIIPILLDDISEQEDTLDPNLSAILGSVTYIKWPSEQTDKKVAKFWKRLQLSLPKKRTTHDEADGDLARRNDSVKIPLPIEVGGEAEVKRPENVIINVLLEEDAKEVVYDQIDDKQLDVELPDSTVDEYMSMPESTKF